MEKEEADKPNEKPLLDRLTPARPAVPTKHLNILEPDSQILFKSRSSKSTLMPHLLLLLDYLK